MGKTLNKGNLYTILARGSFILSRYAIHITMAYLLTNPKDYGDLGVILNIITLFRGLLMSSVRPTSSKFIAENQEFGYPIFSKILRVTLVIGLIGGVVFFAGTPLWTYLLKDESLSKYFYLSAGLIPLLTIYGIQQSYYNGMRKFGFQAFFIGFYSVARFVFALLLVLLGTEIYGIIGGYIIATVVTILVSRRYIPKDDKKYDLTLKSILSFSAPLFVYAIGISSLLSIDILLLKHYFPDSADIGFYTSAMAISKAPYFIYQAFSMTTLSSISFSESSNTKDKSRKIVKDQITNLLLLGLPIAAIVSATSCDLLKLMYPNKYIEAGPVLSILIFSYTGLSLLNLLTTIITAYNKPKISMIIVIALLPIMLISGYFLIPVFSMKGTAYTHLVTVSIGIIVSGIVVYLKSGALINFSRIIKATIISAGLYAGLYYLPDYPSYTLPFIYAGAFGIYIGLMILFKGLKLKDITVFFKK